MRANITVALRSPGVSSITLRAARPRRQPAGPLAFGCCVLLLAPVKQDVCVCVTENTVVVRNPDALWKAIKWPLPEEGFQYGPILLSRQGDGHSAVPFSFIAKSTKRPSRAEAATG